MLVTWAGSHAGLCQSRASRLPAPPVTCSGIYQPLGLSGEC